MGLNKQIKFVIVGMKKSYVQRYVQQYVYQLMGVFYDRLKLGSTAALDCRLGQNKGRYCEKKALIPTRLVALFFNVISNHALII